MKRILVPTDFSDNALKAAMYAAELAGRTAASVHLLHASGIGHEKFTEPVSIYEKYNNLVLDESIEKIENLRSILQQNYPAVSFFTEVDPELHIADAIKNYVEEHSIDIVIMGTKGASGLKSVLLGSVAAAALSNVKVPVLTLPQNYVPAPPGAILLATNHFEHEPFVISTFIDIIHAFPSELHVAVFINSTKTDIADNIHTRERMNEYVRYISKQHPSLNVKPHVLEGDSLEDALELFSLQNNIDIIALVSYPKSFFDKLLLKSTTRNMAFHSRIPVLSIPLQKEASNFANPK